MASTSKVRVGIVGASASRGLCLDRPYPGAAGAAGVRDRRGLHHPPGNGRSRGEALRRAAGLLRPRDSWRGIRTSIWSPSASRCPTIIGRSWPRSRRASTSIASGRSAATPPKPSACSMPRSVAASGMPSGLQGQVSPAINYVRDLIADGYVGRALSATMFVCAPIGEPTIDRAYQADLANGANLMTITGGHKLDALCYCLGEFRELSAFAVSQRDRIPLEATGEMIAKDVPDQLVGQRHRRRRSGRIVAGPRRHDPGHRVPVRDPWRSRAISC